ncbi:hypothetical protein, partial [Magnetococcus sp. PR-3]|uniref:hypothetical protein n=1 Tax=Magnetococcus sp. PR-3 TaxID=3120355 RepID=UPI002FCE37A1
MSIFISPYPLVTTLILQGGISIISLGWNEYIIVSRYVLLQLFLKRVRDSHPPQLSIHYFRKFLYVSAIILFLISLQTLLNSVGDPMEYGKALSWVFTFI